MGKVATAALAAILLNASAVLAADPVCGDVNKSGTVTSGDALLVLRGAVGQPVQLQCPPPSLPLQTGQTTCYDTSGTQIACAGTGQDGELQKGVAHSFIDNGDGTITDNVTGLMWEKLSRDGTIHDYGTQYTWTTAVTTKIAALNSGSFAGHNDWRLPNIKELETLKNFGAVNPATFSPFNTSCAGGCTVLTCSCTQSDVYWSSSTYQDSPSRAWSVYFGDGYSNADDKTFNSFVRAVRSGS